MTFPIQPDELSPQWVTDALRAAGVLEDGNVVAMDGHVLGADKGLTGVLERLTLTYDVQPPDGPASLVAKFSDPNPEGRAIPHSMGFYRRELGFYQQLAGRTPVHTPRCYFAAVEPDSGLSLFLLEDLAPARNGSWVAGCSLDEIELAVSGLARLHAAWWQSPRLDEEPWLQLMGFLCVENVHAVFQDTWQPFLDRLAAPVPEIGQVGELLDRYIEPVCEHLFHARPRSLIHHDFQADNLFFDDTHPSVSVIDWQLCTGGRGPVDVAWLIAGHLPSPVRREHEHRLVQQYHSSLLASGVRDYEFQQCWDDYRLALLLPAWRVAAAVGALPRFDDSRGGFWDAVYPRYCQAIVDLGVAELLRGEGGPVLPGVRGSSRTPALR
jgi:Ser/Thr protein kinase RdoA (MazF antagonist)